MRLGKTFIVGLLLAGMLALAPNISFARGGGGGGHLGGGGHFGGGHGGFAGRSFAPMGHRFHGGDRFHRLHGYYGFYAPFAYGLDAYAYPYDDNDNYSDVQPLPSDGESAAIVQSVQKELARLGYYHGEIDGIPGSGTENAIRWFQSVDHLSVTGQIDGQTLQALGIA